MSYRPRRLQTTLVVFALALAVWASAPTWLSALGGFLVQVDELEQADVIVTLAGDYSGSRVEKTMELLEDGWAPLALLNGATGLFDARECTLALDFARGRGADPAQVEAFCFDADSTLEESRIVDAELVNRGVHSAIVVTSNFHTRRARMIFHSATSGEVEYRFAAAPADGFQPDAWWRSRTGKKTLVVEYLKLVNSMLERAA